MTAAKHRLAVAVMVRNHAGEILLIKNWKRGWEFPGGYVEEGESIEAAAIREVQEEAGVRIRIQNLCGICRDVDQSVCTFLFAAVPQSGQLTADDDSLEAAFCSVDEALDRVNRLHRERIIRCLSERERPFIMEYKNRA